MTLVSIVGDFYSSVVPIFYEFKDKIDTHIILSDDSKRDDFFARQFEVGVNKFIKENNLKIKNLFFSIDEDSFDSLEKALKFILQNSTGEIFINTTDGLATLNTFFSLRAIPQGAKIISYDMFDNEYHIIDINGIKREKICKVLPIKTHFLLKNIEVIDKNPKSFAEIYEKDIKELFIIHKDEYRHFVYDVTVNERFPNRNLFPNVYRIFDKMGFTSKNFKLEDVFQKITGDMFEYFVYLKIKDLEFDDIEVGLEIENSGARNEFDILVMKDNHLHIIECKYRSKIDFNSLIYKYSALRRIVDEDAKSVIVSLKNRYNRFVINRALSHNIALLGLDRNLKDNIKKFLLEDKYDRRNFELVEFKRGVKRNKRYKRYR